MKALMARRALLSSLSLMLKSLLESRTAEKEAAAQKQVWLDPAEALQNLSLSHWGRYILCMYG